jgi:hypothetical protein
MLSKYCNTAVGRGFVARKLVEAGASCVVVNSGMGWDDHQNISNAMRTKLPAMDNAIGTLIEDLVQTGLYKDVVVTLLTEFDRTPRINQNAGRDHWPRTNSVLMGGGNIKAPGLRLDQRCRTLGQARQRTICSRPTSPDGHQARHAGPRQSGRLWPHRRKGQSHSPGC